MGLMRQRQRQNNGQERGGASTIQPPMGTAIRLPTGTQPQRPGRDGGEGLARSTEARPPSTLVGAGLTWRWRTGLKRGGTTAIEVEVVVPASLGQSWSLTSRRSNRPYHVLLFLLLPHLLVAISGTPCGCVAAELAMSGRDANPSARSLQRR